MNAVIRSGQAAFVPRARLLKLLGGELIRDEVMAVVELVKNSHDADARMATVSILTDGPACVIEVRDDGHGMGVDQLLNHWMQPAGSSKRNPQSRRTKSGRIMLGEKGVGRFAVDRLGRFCEVISRRAGAETEIYAHYDWDRFDDADLLLSDVTSSWSERVPEVFTSSSGTLIRVSGLRQDWNRRLFRRLSSKLERIVSPSRGKDSFEIKIISDEFPDYSNSFNADFLGRAPYRLSCRYDDGADLIEFDFNGTRKTLTWPGPGELWCGPVSLTLFGFDLDTESVRKVGPVRDVRAWLKEWSGITIYRDGFRVMPYGEPDDDWLRLDQRRINNPSHRFSNSQLVGQIDITREGNPLLIDQTNRGGVIENSSFASLRSLCHFIITEFEDLRADTRERRARTDKSAARPTTQVDDVIREFSSSSRSISAKASEAFGPVLSKIRQAYMVERASAAVSEDRLLGLAASGLGTRHIFHTLSHEIRSLRAELETLRQLVPGNMAVVDGLADGFRKVEDLVSVFGEVGGGIESTSSELDLKKEISNFLASHKRMAAAEGVQVISRLDRTSHVVVKGKRSDLWRLLTILFNNSFEATADCAGDAEIEFQCLSEEGKDTVALLVVDNGHGVPDRIAPSIFEDGFTTRDRAGGMGLFVASRIAGRNAWKLELCSPPDNSWNTCFKVEFEQFRIS